ncbi:hypothetical protein AJ78_05383 [Emergomyces pasteurianus Ep9510]|uniref:Uncharacterized protein n=1 Tax=Emergomyces pasteurianus Ep9510 TaxID=1447872 RepID=A0A1J9PDZ7_9EURO|nr:hypothetical protein AJ78_05383 [Emergomyces pasteurianus Ep9510]
MGQCRFSMGTMRCVCDSGTARSNLYEDNSDAICSVCDHPMALHTDYHPSEDVTSKPEEESETPLRIPNDICPRQKTVCRLAELIENYTVIHVRGTPSSGKSTLAYLLHHYYKSKGKKSILQWAWSGKDPAIVACVKLYNDTFNTSITTSDFYHDTNDTVYIIDEAQTSYTDFEFWFGILKTQSGRGQGPKFCLFASYGSPVTGAEAAFNSTPVFFGQPQRVSLLPSSNPFSSGIGLFYTMDEFEDALTRLARRPELPPFAITSNASMYLYRITNGHPAGLHALVARVLDVYHSQLKHQLIKEIDEPHIVAAIDDERATFNFLTSYPIFRSFPRSKYLTPDSSKALNRTLMNGSIPFDEADQGIKLCYKFGWLHTEALDLHGNNTVCVFPSRIHEKFVETFLSDNSKSFPIEQYPTIESLCSRVLHKFSKGQLQEACKGRILVSGAKQNPEAQFQHEFYRAFKSLVHPNVGISSEWSGCAGGRVDFVIVGPKWGIELLRDGDRLAEHLDRFSDTGKYSTWIKAGQLMDWLILDCRHSLPKPTAIPYSKLWRVVFKNNYSSMEILDSQNNAITSEFPLMN